MISKNLIVCLLICVCGCATAQDSKWENLFDGKTLKGWNRLVGKADYQVEKGMIVGVTVANNANSFLAFEKEYGDFMLEMDVMMDDTSSNSGVQFRSHFDPNGNNGFGQVYGYQYELDPSSRKWTGGIYEEGRREWLYPLTLNTSAQDDFKVGKWNKIRIECRGFETKTFINGTLASYLSDTVSLRGLIALQVHGTSKPEQVGRKIFWRNIRIKANDWTSTPVNNAMYQVNLMTNSLSSFEKKQGFRLLFDGSTSNGWKGAYKPGFPEKGWQVKDGLLTVLSSEGKESANGGDIVTLDQFSAFDLSFDFKLTTGANSGVKYFVTLTENNEGSAIGLEYQLLDDKVHPDALLGRDGNRTLASLYDLIPAIKQARFVHPPGQWNTGRIVVRPNNHVEHYLNGMKVLEYERGSQDYRALVAMSKYKVWKNFGEAKKGHILLQDHGNETSFRNIKIRTLK